MSYKEFRKKWLGRSVDYDGVYGRQCVDLIKQYLAEVYKIKAGSWGNAIDYWNNPNPNLLKKFKKIKSSNGLQGDIVIFKGGKYGHIGVVDSVSRLYVATLEQNGSTGGGTGKGGDAIRVRNIFRWRVAGLLRPLDKKNPVYYRVRLGDTVGRICKKHSLTLEQFKKLNPKVRNVNIIYPGQKLRVK